MDMKRGISIALATALGSAGFAGVAVAQQGLAMLEEVVVTARRIEEKHYRCATGGGRHGR